MPQCSRSVSGLIVSLTHLLTRTKSFHASGDRARSRGAVVVLAHSPGCRAQNSTHPAGGRVTSEARTWASRSGPARAGGVSMVLAAITAINTVIDFRLKTLVLPVATMFHFIPVFEFF